MQNPLSSTPYNPLTSGNPQSATSRSYPNGNPAAPLNPPAARNTDSCLPTRPAAEIVHNYRCAGPAPGNIAFRWIYGSPIAAHNRDPRVQVMQYNEDTYILRQNICVHWEGPFTYLLFGNRGALLIDTGATASSLEYPLRPTVDGIIRRWCSIRRKASVPLTVVMTSPEDVAQNQGRSQFVGRPDTLLVPSSLPQLRSFFGLAASWPAGTGHIDLGDRVLDVIPTPGAHRDGVSFYDPYTQCLFTGDLLYPGKIQISNDKDFTASLERLQQWKAAHPVKFVLGGHIEMQFLPGKAYPRFYTYKPYERVLEMTPDLIDDALAASRDIQGKQMVLVRPDFQLFNGVSPDEKTPAFPAGVPNLTAPRPF